MARSQVDNFVERLKAIANEVQLVGNYPWIYLDRINGVRVTEKFLANHGFTIAFYPKETGQPLNIVDLRETFKLVRKYVEAGQ